MPAKETKKLNINNLIPNEKYVVQVRAIDGKDESEWSQKFHFKTISDQEGTGGPSVPQNVAWVQGPESVIAEWDTVEENVNGTPANVTKYEVEVSGTVGGTPIVNQSAHVSTQNGTGREGKPYSISAIRSIFNLSIPDELNLRVRTVNSGGSRSDWSATATILIGKPDPPTDAVPPPNAESIIDAVKLRWTPPVNMANVAGYVVYVGTTSDFTPSATKKIYQGGATTATHNTIAYDVTQYYKIRAYSLFGKESDDLLAEGRPKSPYGPDLDPPQVPVITEPITMDADRTSAQIAWTLPDELADINKDISGFVVAWKRVSETAWRNSYFDKAARNGLISLPLPYSNYQFKIAAYDFVANYSAYSAVSTLTGNVAAPGQTVGVTAAAGLDNLRISWTESTSLSVQTGGFYEIQFNTTGTFASDTVPTPFKTSDTSYAVSGLTNATTYYFRVRAVDSDLQTGPWSATATKDTTDFPIDPTSDGLSPANPPTALKATGGLNYINVSWTKVVNPDSTWYEVHMGTTSGFTVNAGSFVAEAFGTSQMVNSLPNGDPLLQETEYFFKVRAVDADGPGPESTAVSAELTQVLSTDLGINMGGENLFYNSSFDVDSDANGLADYWEVVNSTPGTEPTTPTLVEGRTGPSAQRVSWTGINSGTKGLRSINSSVLRKNTEYVLSFYARANGGTGFAVSATPAFTSTVWVDNPTPSATEWQRYIVKVVTGATFDATNANITLTGNTVNGGWLEVDDAQIEAGNLASAYKTGTVSIAKLASGRMSTAEMIIDSTGLIRSDNYNLGTKTGFSLSTSGLNLFTGQVNANTLVANSSFVNDLNIGSKLTVATNGKIQSANYSPGGGANPPAAGYQINDNLIDIRTGIVAVGTLIGGTISAATINLGLNAAMIVDDSSAVIRSNNYNYIGPGNPGNTGWKLSSTGLEMWDANSKINIAAIESGTLDSTNITVGSGGTIRSKDWNAGTGARWLLAENGFTMIGGTITGSTVITDQLYSSTDVPNPAGGTRKSFSINGNGYAELTGAYVYGNLIVSDSSVHRITSANYNPGYSGWQITGNGVANFNSLGVGGGGGQDYMVVESISGKAYIRLFRGSDGVLLGDFKSGPFGVTVASPASSLDLTGPNVYVNGGLVITGSVYTTQTVTAGQVTGSNITSHTNVAAGHTFNAGGMPWAGGNARYVMVGDDGWFTKGPPSSERYKNSIAPLSVPTSNILALEPKQFKYNIDGANGTVVSGFIAEEADELGLDMWVIYDNIDGTVMPDGFRYTDFVVAHQIVLRNHQQEIADLKARIEVLEGA